MLDLLEAQETVELHRSSWKFSRVSLACWKVQETFQSFLSALEASETYKDFLDSLEACGKYLVSIEASGNV